MYYIFINKEKNYYYCNKSNNPNRSIQTHIRRANNSLSRNYNKSFYIDLRDHYENFITLIYDRCPIFVEKLKSYLPMS